jgi:hypothetical protein
MKNVAHFSEPKYAVPNHHIYHAKHHVLTIKKPRFLHPVSQNPLQKPNKTSKTNPEDHSKKNPQKIPKPNAPNTSRWTSDTREGKDEIQ